MSDSLNTIGKRIAHARKSNNLTQSELAEKLNVSFQAVSLWERDQSAPDTYNLIELAKVLGVSVSSIVEDRGYYRFKTQDKIFDYTHMASFIKHSAKAYKMHNTIKALEFASKAHQNQTRKNSDIPYIYHPLNMTCHLFAMDLYDDDLACACLLHDVLEDCDYTADDLPVSDNAKELVLLLTKEKGDDKDKINKKYFKNIRSNPGAALIKCLDRINNMTTMSWGLSRDKIYEFIYETEEYVLPLIKIVKAEPEYNNAAWLIQYQMESMLDIYKRLM